MRFLKAATALSFLLLACPLISLGQTNPTAREQVTYFLGEVKMSSPAGQPYGSTLSLVKRTLKPAENKIVEVVASIDPREPTKEYTTVFNIEGAKFTVKDEEGTFSGDGELIGKAWEWTGWKYSVKMLGQRKGTLKAEDMLGDSGLTVRKTFSSPDGQVRVIFTEDLKRISKEMYDILHDKILPERK